MKSKPSAFDLLIISAMLWSLPFFVLINAATGDCIGSDCPTEIERALPIFGAVVLSFLLQIAAAVWYVRAQNRD